MCVWVCVCISLVGLRLLSDAVGEDRLDESILLPSLDDADAMRGCKVVRNLDSKPLRGTAMVAITRRENAREMG